MTKTNCSGTMIEVEREVLGHAQGEAAVFPFYDINDYR